MEMQQIRYFIAAAETLNFTEAAHKCNVSQPALSRAIKNLESELGGALFRRERALSHLTDLGHMVIPLLTQCYNSAVAAKDLALSVRSGATAPLRIAISQSVDIKLLLPFLAELAKAISGLQLQFFRGDAKSIAVRLKSGDSEVAIAGPLDDGWERLDAWTLFEEGFGLVVQESHPLALRSQIRMQDLAGLRLIARPYCEQACAIEQMLRTGGVEQRQGDDILSDQDMLGLIEANIGAAIMPGTAVEMSRLRLVTVEGLFMTRAVKLYAVAGRARSAAATGLMNLLRAADWSTLVRRTQPSVAA